MTDMFAKVALGPLLLAQGLYTRWVTPRLPPFYAVTRLLREESVVRLLGNHQLRQRNVYALYPSRRFLDAKVKTWVDFLKVELPQFLAEQESVVNDSRHWQ
jgi:DNA-binding transcriptional LysR family regulator